jgi:aminopeptidase N
MAAPLTRWQRYAPARQRQMIDALTEVAKHENLSKDLFEVVTKSLER